MHNGCYSTDILKKINLFRDLTPEQLNQLGGSLHFKRFPAGATIFSMDQPSEVIYCLLSGTVKICVDQTNGAVVLLGLYGSGEILDELSALDGANHYVTAVTREPSELLWMNRTAFREYLCSMPAITYSLAQLLAKRLYHGSRRNQSLHTADVCGRVACQLLSFACDYGESTLAGDIVIPIRVTQGDLATLIGASRENVNKALTYYRRNRIISIEQGYHVTIHDEAALQIRCK